MKQEAAESATSYAIGLGAYIVAKLADLSSVAHDLTLIIVCIGVAVRVTYDTVRLVRYLKDKDAK